MPEEHSPTRCWGRGGRRNVERHGLAQQKYAPPYFQVRSHVSRGHGCALGVHIPFVPSQFTVQKPWAG